MRQKSKKAQSQSEEALKGIREGRFKNAAVAASSTRATRSVIYARVKGNAQNQQTARLKEKAKAKACPRIFLKVIYKL